MGVRQVSPKATVLHFQNSARIVDCRHNWSFSELCHGKGMGCTAAHFYGGEEIWGADLARIQAEYAHRYLATSFSFSCLILILMRHHQCPSTCFKEILKQACQEISKLPFSGSDLPPYAFNTCWTPLLKMWWTIFTTTSRPWRAD